MSKKKSPVKVTEWLEKRIVRRIGGIILNADAWDKKMHEYQAYIYVDGNVRRLPQKWVQFSTSTYTEDGYKVHVRVLLDVRVGVSSLRLFTTIKEQLWTGKRIRWSHVWTFKDGESLPFNKIKEEWGPKVDSLLAGAGISLIRRPHGGPGKDQPEDQPDGADQDGGDRAH